MHVTISAWEEAPRFKKGRHELCMVCPRIYANMYICMPIYSQLPVLLGKKWQVWLQARAQASHSPRACSVRREGAPVDAAPGGDLQCWGRGIASLLVQVFGMRADSPWDGKGRWNLRLRNYFLIAYSPPPVAGVCLGLVTLHQDVLHSRLGCNYHPPAASGPKMLKYLSCPAQSTPREEGRWGAASHIPTLLLIFPRHPPYQPFIPPSLVKAIGEKSCQEIQGTLVWAAAGSTELCVKLEVLQLS